MLGVAQKANPSVLESAINKLKVDLVLYLSTCTPAYVENLQSLIASEQRLPEHRQIFVQLFIEHLLEKYANELGILRAKQISEEFHKLVGADQHTGH